MEGKRGLIVDGEKVILGASGEPLRMPKMDAVSPFDEAKRLLERSPAPYGHT